jgi:hypothetical protein
MAATDRPGSSQVMDPGQEHGSTEAGLVTARPQDAAGSAAQVIEGEALSIFQAVDATAAQMADAARHEADAIARAYAHAAGPALEDLDAMSQHLRALAADLQHKAEEARRRREHGV